MNRETMAGQWKQVRGKVRERWGKLTDDDLDVIAGKRDQLVGKIQERYGVAKEKVERDVEDFETGYSDGYADGRDEGRQEKHTKH